MIYDWVMAFTDWEGRSMDLSQNGVERLEVSSTGTGLGVLMIQYLTNPLKEESERDIIRMKHDEIPCLPPRCDQNIDWHAVFHTEYSSILKWPNLYYRTTCRKSPFTKHFRACKPIDDNVYNVSSLTTCVGL
jgi:hypothetical protein